MKRIFIHSNKICKKNCKYCFSNWDSYTPPQIDYNDFDDVIAFYPTCDSDFEIDWSIYERILNKYNDTQTIIFSFSIKGEISDALINDVVKLNSKIRKGLDRKSVV